MQELTAEISDEFFSAPVGFISDYRVTNVGKVNPNLMGSSGS